MARKTTTIFSRLLHYFFWVMAIPLAVLIIVYFYYTESRIADIIYDQTEQALINDVENIEDLFEEYNRKAISIASDGEIIEIMKNDKMSADSSKYAYTLLFSQIGSNIAQEQIHILSSTGKVRLSTHNFPQEYDIRIYNNDWDNLNIISKSLTKDQKSSNRPLISIETHRTVDKGKLIIATLLREIKDENGSVIGYVIIDLYSEALLDISNGSSIYKDILLIDYSSYMAVSLLHPNTFGSLDKFSIKGENLISIEKPIANTDMALIVVEDISPYRTSIYGAMLLLFFAIIIGSIVSVTLSLIFSHSITKRFKTLTESMKSIESGNLSVTLDSDTGIEEFNELSISFNKMILQLNELIELTREEESKLAEAERKELESQLNPHFLFNTLNTIKALARLNGQDEIYTISLKLGKLLRSSLNKNKSECTLRESVNLVEGYLTIQKIRFKDKINYTIDGDESVMDEITPRLIIQPLVENAIIHGLEPMTAPGEVEIKIKDMGDMIFISIKDNGIGFDATNIEHNAENLANGEHVGLYNVYRRLQLKYAERFRFKLESRLNQGTLIEMELPKGDRDELYSRHS